MTKLRQFCIDLQSFMVEAENADEARELAIARLKSGEEQAVIDQIIDEGPSE